jgi:WD40 repeat protein
VCKIEVIGQTLAGSDDKTIKLWNLKTGDFLRALAGHKKAVLSLAFSPDGQTLASGGDDKTIKLWSPKTGGLLRTLTGHKGPVDSIAISPDGRTLISSDYYAIKWWYLKSGNLLRTIKIYTLCASG